MPNAISAIKRTVGERIGWNRIGFAISVVILVVACAALFRLLRDIEVDKVVAALRATSIETVLTAGIFVVCGYITLTFYDLFSLRTIGTACRTASPRSRASPATPSGTISARPYSPAVPCVSASTRPGVSA
jgi:uncharacterized membrane protein YbhN (UPF0104 family)